MNQDYTHITMVIDKSGSMAGLTNDTIGGFNSFLKTQRETPGKATMTLIQFSTDYSTTFNGVNVQDAPDLNASTYVPGGGTALLDALHRAITETNAFIAGMDEADRPGRVLIVTITDGEENSSRKIKIDALKKLVSDKETATMWRFIFMGANLDSFSTSQNLGMTTANNSLNYQASRKGIASAYASLSESTSNLRGMSYCASVDRNTEFFTVDQQDQQNP